MEILTIQQLTRNDIRSAIREELEEFFAENKISTAQTDTDEIGGIELAVEVTGLAKPTIYTKVSNRTIPHSKRGKKLYFSRRELNEWIANGKRKTQTEIAEEAENYEQNKTRAINATNDKSLSNQ